MIPEGWRTYNLGGIAELRKEQVTPNGEEQPYIGLEHIDQQSLRLNSVGSSKDVISNKNRFYPGDILYGKLRPYFRKVYQPKFGGVCSTDIYVIKNKDTIDNTLLFYLIALEEFTNIANSGSTGTRMPRADWSQLQKSEWTIPNSLDEQKEIASILSSLDDKIELNLQMNKTLEAIAQAIFKEWSVDFRFPGFDGELVDGLPKGWRIGKVSDTCKVNANTLSYKDKLDEIRYIEISEVERGIVKNITFYKRGEEPSRAKRKLAHGDIAISTVRPNRGSYFLAFQPENNLIASTGFAVFTAISVPYSFLYCFLSAEEQIEYYGRMADGAAYPAINPTVIMNIELTLPDEEVLKLFNDKVGVLYSKIYENLKENQTLIQLRDILLPKLMTGKIKVA